MRKSVRAKLPIKMLPPDSIFIVFDKSMKTLVCVYMLICTCERIKSPQKVLLTLDVVCLHSTVFPFFAKLLTFYDDKDRYTLREIERKRHCNTLTETRLLFDWWVSCLMNYTWRICEGYIFRVQKCEWYNFRFFFTTFLVKLYSILLYKLRGKRVTDFSKLFQQICRKSLENLKKIYDTNLYMSY